MKTILSRLRQDVNLFSLLKGAGLMYVAGVITIGLTFLQQITTVNLVGFQVYGQFAAITSSALVILLIVDFRTREASTKYQARYQANGRFDELVRMNTWLITLDLAAGLIGSLLVLIFAAPIAEFMLQDAQLIWLVCLMAIFLPLNLIARGVPTATLRLYDYYGWISVKSMIFACTRLVFVTGAAYLGFGLVGVLVGFLLSEFIHTVMITIMMLMVLRRKLPANQPRIEWTRPQDTPSILPLLRDLWISGTLKGVQGQAFIPIVALLVSPVQVGILRTGLDLSTLIYNVIRPLEVVMDPHILRAYEQDSRSDFLRIIGQMMGLVSLLTLPFAIVIVFFGSSVLPVFIEDTTSELIEVTRYLTMAVTFAVIMQWLRPALIATDQLQAQNKISIFTAFMTTILLFTLVPVGGIVVAALVRLSMIVINNSLRLTVFVAHLRLSRPTTYG